MSAAAMPFVSVIVPTHRRAALLARLLRSLLAQQWPADRFEIIVVHNYTDDGTDRAVAEIARDAAVPIAYHRTQFSGPGPSRQFGADHAKGSVLAFIDDDCEATPRWLAEGVAELSRGYGLVQGRTQPHPSQPRRFLEKTVNVPGPTPYFETCNIFYDAAAFRAVGGFPAAFRERFYAEDTALGWTMLRAGYRTGFAEAAVAYHEVFAVSFRSWLMEPRNMRYWPYLSRAFPELRRKLFLGVFLSPLTATFDLAVIGLLVAILHPTGLLLTVPYLALRLFDRSRFRAPHVLLARLLFGLPRACVLAATLAASSIRARRLVI
ncbi:MAG: glycosyltransferase family A protein [Acetobacteraceae bacterium]